MYARGTVHILQGRFCYLRPCASNPCIFAKMLRWLVSLALLVLAAPTCNSPAGADDCQVCAMADLCCGMRTANPESNCKLHETCEMFTGQQRAGVVSGCQDYLRI